MCVSLFACVLVSFSHGAMGWTVICDSDNSWPYSLTFFIDHPRLPADHVQKAIIFTRPDDISSRTLTFHAMNYGI